MASDDERWVRRVALWDREAGGVTATVGAITNVATLALIMDALVRGRGPITPGSLIPAAVIAGLATLVAAVGGVRLAVAGARAAEAFTIGSTESAEQAFRSGARAAAMASLPAVLQVLVAALLFAGGLPRRYVTVEAAWLVVLLLPIPLIPINALAATRLAQRGLGEPPGP